MNSEEEQHAVQKLEAIGRLAGGIAHDFNNLLTGIAGTAEDIKNSMPEKDSRRVELDEIAQACARAFDMTRQLLAFARRQVCRPEVLDLSKSAIELSKVVRRLVGEDIIVRQDLEDVRSVRMDRAQLEQIMMNLAINAREAMPKGGHLTLHTANVELTGAEPAFKKRLKAGAYVLLRISDTGHGMNQDTLNRLFEPYFSTKRSGRGAGLGLATVYGIVNQNRGSIFVASSQTSGSSFSLYFPAVEEPVTLQPSVIKAPIYPHGDEIVLVAEDEDLVRRIILKKLRHLGYHVLEARNGLEALDIFRKQAETIQLIVTDVIMPGLNGKDFVHQAPRAASRYSRAVYVRLFGRCDRASGHS